MKGNFRRDEVGASISLQNPPKTTALLMPPASRETVVLKVPSPFAERHAYHSVRGALAGIRLYQVKRKACANWLTSELFFAIGLPADCNLLHFHFSAGSIGGKRGRFPDQRS